MWFTENGRDRLSDTTPRDELNEATASGQNFGFPYVHAGYIADPEYASLYKGSAKRDFRSRRA